jgi:hypothetical protein
MRRGYLVSASLKIAKPEAPLDAVNFLRQLPIWGLCVRELRLLAREWRYFVHDQQLLVIRQRRRRPVSTT